MPVLLVLRSSVDNAVDRVPIQLIGLSSIDRLYLIWHRHIEIVMSRENMSLLEQHFDVAFAAPDGIKKLRELILTLTMSQLVSF